MTILAQSFETGALLDCIVSAIESIDTDIFRSDWKSARATADEALANIYTYKMCRDEGMSEPDAPSYIGHSAIAMSCAMDYYDSADAFVGAAESDLRYIASITDDDL